MKYERVWVDADFKKRLKEIAAQNDTTILELTREVSKYKEPFEVFGNGKKSKKFNFM